MAEGEPLLEARALVVELGGRRVLDSVDLDAREGSFTVVMGRSGTGKSVLLKALTGFVPRLSGQVMFRGKVVDPASAEFRAQVVLVHQEAALLDDRTVLENVADVLRWRGVDGDALRSLERCGVSGVAGALPSSLSGGERKLVALARALALRPRVMLLDEPTTGLDPATAARVADACNAVVANGTALVLVTHDLPPFAARATQVVVLHAGHVLSRQDGDESRARPHAALVQLLEGHAHGPLTDEPT